MTTIAQLPTVDPQSVKDGSALWSSQGYIDGMQLAWVSGNSLSVTSGRAYVPSLGRTLELPATYTLAGLSLAANTWYHAYIYLDGSIPKIELVTTAPSAPYYGTARTKTGDTSRRYLGSIITDGSSNIRQFVHVGGKILYSSVGITGRIVTNAANTAAAIVSCASVVPITARSAYLKLQNNGPTNTSAYVSPGNITASPGSAVVTVGGVTGAALITYGECPLDDAQQLSYVCDATGGTPAFYITVINYSFER